MSAAVAITAASPEALEQWGRELAAELPPFTVIVLVGELGAGKTTLMKGIAEGWGVARAEEITSPTYTLIHEYRRGPRALYHLDLYRIETAPQLATLGLDDLLAPPDAGQQKLIAIEWGERLEPQLARPYLRIELSHASADTRAAAARWVR